MPIIRIFGTDLKGTKTCAHVHGVFPYLYVPYAGGDAVGESDRLSYQLASSIDKAINISLGQTNSSTQHVFKIILVKAKSVSLISSGFFSQVFIYLTSFHLFIFFILFLNCLDLSMDIINRSINF